MTIVDGRRAGATRPTRAAGGAGASRAAGSVAPVHRRRSLPHLVVGGLLVVTVALAAAVLESRRDVRLPVVAVARPVAAGQVLASADLAVARIVSEAAVRTVPAGQLTSMVGRTAAVPLQPGTLLSPDAVGPAGWPPPGQAVVAVAVKAGRTPAGLVDGARVTVMVIAQGGVGADGAGPPVVRGDATVVGRTAAEDQPGTMVVSLLLPDEAATRIASATGEVSLVVRAAT